MDTPTRVHKMMRALLGIVFLVGMLNTKQVQGRKARKLNYFEYNAMNCRAHTACITQFGGVGDGTTSNTKAFQAAVAHLSQFESDGGSLLFVPAGKWLTGSFNLTSHFTLFLDRDAVLLASQVMEEWPLIDALPSYGRGRDAAGGRYASLIFGSNLTDVIITGRAMSNKGKAPMSSSTQSKKRGYVTWTKQMDEIMIGVLHNQLKEGNKAEGEWKPQAYHAVADELRATMSAVVSTDNVRNRLKSWKKHYANISDIRTLTKFRWDEDRKMIVIGSEDSEQWSTFIKENPPAAQYKNKSIEYWDDICTLCGPDRALGDGVEMHDEAAEAMDDDVESEGGSSSRSMSSSKSKKQKRDKLADAVTSFTECFREYVQSKPKDKPKPTPQEIHEVVKSVEGIGRHQVMKATRKFSTGPLSDFEMLKSLPNDDKLDWVLECLGDDTDSSIY